MNIGVIIPGFSSDEFDAAIPIQLNLAREQANYVDLRVVAMRYPHRRDHYQVFGAHVYSLGYGAWSRGARRLRLWVDAYRLLAKLHREKPFDVLHAMWADETGLIAGWFGARHKIPVVVSVLGGELAALEDIEYGGQLSRFGRWTTGQALKYASRIHVPSGFVRTLLEKSAYRVDFRRVITMPLGVDTSLFYPDDKAFKPHHLISVASLIPVKDHTTLFHALVRLPDSITLDLIGDGVDRAWLEHMAQDLGIAWRVRFLGAVPHDQLPPHYRQAALHILSSRHETFALSIAEAAACGTPSISTRVGVLPDYPMLGTTVTVGDPDGLAASIANLVGDSAGLAALRRSASAAVIQELSIERMAARLRGVYEDLLHTPVHSGKINQFSR